MNTKENTVLGKISQVTIGTSDVQASVAMYEKMGFRKINSNTMPNPWVQLTDDSILILLNQDGMQYMGLTYFAADMDKRVKRLEEEGLTLVQKLEHEGRLTQAILMSPDQFFIALVNHDASNMFQPTGKKFGDFWGDEGIITPIEYPNEVCGIFGELCHPVKDLQISLAFWKLLGFTADRVFEKPYPWAIVEDGKNIIGLHQTSDFDTPALTYFALDMGERIKRVRENGVDSIKIFEGTGGDEKNVVVTTPEGQKFFLFSL